jgi:hypothetical protein
VDLALVFCNSALERDDIVAHGVPHIAELGVPSGAVLSPLATEGGEVGAKVCDVVADPVEVAGVEPYAGHSAVFSRIALARGAAAISASLNRKSRNDGSERGCDISCVFHEELGD